MKAKRKLERPGLSDTGTGKVKRPLAPRNVSVLKFENTDERALIAEAHKTAGMHMFYGDRNKTKEYVSMGYTPVLDEGEQVHHKGDPLYKIPEETFRGRRQASEMMSVNILEQARMGGRSEDTVRDSSGEAHRVVVEKTID
jgi:hypothetical protein